MAKRYTVKQVEQPPKTCEWTSTIYNGCIGRATYKATETTTELEFALCRLHSQRGLRLGRWTTTEFVGAH